MQLNYLQTYLQMKLYYFYVSTLISEFLPKISERYY